MRNDTRTSITLVARLQQGVATGADWNRFFRQYAKMLVRFFQRCGISEVDAEDLLQETLMLVLRKLPEFNYDPSKGRFRGWLTQLARGKMCDFIRTKLREGNLSLDHEQAPQVDDGERQAEEAEAAEWAWRMTLVEEALRRLEQDPQTKPETFAAFHAYAVKGESAAEVAKQFGLQANALYQIKSRVVERVREIVEQLAAEEEAALSA